MNFTDHSNPPLSNHLTQAMSLIRVDEIENMNVRIELGISFFH